MRLFDLVVVEMAHRALEFSMVVRENHYPDRSLREVVAHTTDFAIHTWLDADEDKRERAGRAATAAWIAEAIYDWELAVAGEQQKGWRWDLGPDELEMFQAELNETRQVLNRTGNTMPAWMMLKRWARLAGSPMEPED